jgi:hypothetical protein
MLLLQKKKMQVPLDSSDVPLKLLHDANILFQDNPDIADISVEATNFPFSVNVCSQDIHITRPVRDRTIRLTNSCWQRVLGFTSVKHFIQTDRIDSNDLVWLSKSHRDAIRRVILHHGLQDSYKTLLQELE